MQPNPYDSPEELPAAESKPPVTKSKPHPHIVWAILWWFGIMAVQLFVGVVLVVIAMAVAAANGLTDQQEMMKFVEQFQIYAIPLSTFACTVAAVLTAFVMYRKQVGVRLNLRSASLSQWFAVILIVVPQMILAGEVGNIAAEVLPDFGLEVFADFSALPLAFVLIGGCLFPAIWEEIIFRGILSRGLIGHHGVILGVFFTSAFFATMHMFPLQVCVTFIAGVGIQLVYLATRSLPAAIVLHAVNNSLAFLMMRHAGDLAPIPGVTVAESATTFGHTPMSLLLTAALAVATLAWFFWQARTTWQLDGEEWTPGFLSIDRASNALTAYSRTPSVLAWAAVIVTQVMLVANICWLSGMF